MPGCQFYVNYAEVCASSYPLRQITFIQILGPGPPDPDIYDHFFLDFGYLAGACSI
jgi:hypothetical protein